jgi:nucleoside-diphosphate-sugar epimerase
VKLVVGCGYLGSRVARLWRAQGETVAVVTRSADRAREFKEAGYTPIVADISNSRSLTEIESLAPLDSVLYAVGYDRSSVGSKRDIYVEGLRNVLNALGDSVGRFIYVGTIGVYGQNDGSWIDEDAPCEPTREDGRIHLEAEGVLRNHACGSRAFVLRLAGIYGPGRIPRREELAAGKPVNASPDAYLNLIHVEDAAQIVLAIEKQIQPPRLYLVSDGHPVVRREYYAEVSRLLAAPTPTFAPLDDKASEKHRGHSNRRVSNARLRSEVDFEFQYPDYKSGLAAIVASPH